jgi:hypothetical protein
VKTNSAKPMTSVHRVGPGHSGGQMFSNPLSAGAVRRLPGNTGNTGEPCDVMFSARCRNGPRSERAIDVAVLR